MVAVSASRDPCLVVYSAPVFPYWPILILIDCVILIWRTNVLRLSGFAPLESARVFLKEFLTSKRFWVSVVRDS